MPWSFIKGISTGSILCSFLDGRAIFERKICRRANSNNFTFLILRSDPLIWKFDAQTSPAFQSLDPLIILVASHWKLGNQVKCFCNPLFPHFSFIFKCVKLVKQHVESLRMQFIMLLRNNQGGISCDFVHFQSFKSIISWIWLIWFWHLIDYVEFYNKIDQRGKLAFNWTCIFDKQRFNQSSIESNFKIKRSPCSKARTIGVMIHYGSLPQQSGLCLRLTILLRRTI